MCEITIQDVAERLNKVGLQFFATIGLDGKPKVRPMQYMVIEDGKLWFCTNSEKAVYAEMMSCPTIELCGSKLEEDEIESVWIRLSADVVFEDNYKVKEMIMQKSSIVRKLYENKTDHSKFKVFYLKNIKGEINNLGHVKGVKNRSNFAKPVYFEL